MTAQLELGLDTFGDVTEDSSGGPVSQARVLRDLVDQAVLADELGVNFFGVGEHHRDDFAVSSPEVVLASIASRTKQIHLGSAVTVLSSDDPVRVFERFSTLNALSKGRAEVILGRGSFTESFALFGFELNQYEILFEERLELFSKLLHDEAVTWSGTTRSALSNQRVYPTLEAGGLTTWVGVGGSPESVARAARHQMPLMLAIIGGSAARFAPLVDLYYQSLELSGFDRLPVGVHSPGYVAPSDQQAREELWPHMKRSRDRVGAERGWGPMTIESFNREAGDHGSLYVGSPVTVAKKIVATARAIGLARFDMKYSAGRMPHEQLMRSIGLYGREVIPLVREMLG